MKPEFAGAHWAEIGHDADRIERAGLVCETRTLMKMTPGRTLAALIGVSAAIRLVWAATLGPCTDEAYHYLFTVHPDWSYFDHPPLLAVVERVGPLLLGGLTTPLALRLGFIALFAGSTWLMFRIGDRIYGPFAGLLAAFALNVSAYHTAAAGAFALPDGPLLFFWLLTLDRLIAAIAEPDRLGPWVGVGLAWGFALLSKYHAIFLPAGAVLYLVVEPEARRILRRPGPYLASALGLALFTPVLVWNAQHGWASFVFQGGRAVGSAWPRPDFLLGAVAGSAAYLFPWLWWALVVVLIRSLKGFRQASPTDRFLLCQALPPLVAFSLVACVRSVLPHWMLVGYLPLMPMLGRSWEVRWQTDPIGMGRRFRWLAVIPVAIMGLTLVEYRFGMLQQGGRLGLTTLPARIDPTVDLYGWDQVASELDRRGLLRDRADFLFTGSWYHSGQLAYATRKTGMPVLCYNHHDARSFAFWSRPEDWVGRTGLLVSVNDRATEPTCYDRFFTRIELVAAFPVIRAGVPVRTIRVFRCERQTEAFPFLPGEPDPASITGPTTTTHR